MLKLYIKFPSPPSNLNRVPTHVWVGGIDIRPINKRPNNINFSVHGFIKVPFSKENWTVKISINKYQTTPSVLWCASLSFALFLPPFPLLLLFISFIKWYISLVLGLSSSFKFFCYVLTQNWSRKSFLKQILKCIGTTTFSGSREKWVSSKADVPWNCHLIVASVVVVVYMNDMNDVTFSSYQTFMCFKVLA